MVERRNNCDDEGEGEGNNSNISTRVDLLDLFSRVPSYEDLPHTSIPPELDEQNRAHASTKLPSSDFGLSPLGTGVGDIKGAAWELVKTILKPWKWNEKWPPKKKP